MTTDNGDPPPKSAERLAGRIVDDIAAAGWPVGRVLGTEPELDEARAMLEVEVVEQAIERLDRDGESRLRAVIDHEQLVVPDDVPGHTSCAALDARRHRR